MSLWPPPAAGLGLQDTAAVLGITSQHNHAQRKNRNFVLQDQENPRSSLTLLACMWVRALRRLIAGRGLRLTNNGCSPFPGVAVGTASHLTWEIM